MNDRHLLENELDSLLVHADLDLPSDQAEHLAECSDCQKRMEQLAAENADWDSAKENLASSFDPLASIDFLVVEPRLWGHVAGEAFTESMAIQLLQPPSHPEMLGRLGRYEVERLIGSGGMGIVFKAFDTELHRPVAIKSLAPFLAGSGSARHRFAREARAAAAVVHYHVVPIHNVETDHSVPYLVMQYIAGDSLQTRLDREGTIELAEILRIGMQVASGLAAAHSQGLIHRDVKPSNILLDENVSRALLTDFGLARTQDDACLTRSGFQPGTPSYMSPEQVRGEDLDGRSDLFGLGCVLYALCTGHPPFRAESGYAILRRITDETPRSICEQNPSIPAWFERIVMKLLEKDRTARYQSATDLSQDLEQCLAHVQKPTIATLPTWMTMIPSSDARYGGSRSRIGKWLAGGLASVAIIFAGIFIVLESNKGTLTIKSEVDNVPIRIKQSDKVIEELIVNRTGKTLRVSAGEYTVELDGDLLGFVIEGNELRLNRGESKSIQIAYSKPAVTSVEPFDQRSREDYTGASHLMGPGGTGFDLPLAKKTERLAQDALGSAKAKNQAGTASLAEVAEAQKALGLAKQNLVDALGNRPGEVADPLDVKSLTNCLIEHEKSCHQLLDAAKIDYQSGLNDIDTLASAQRSLLDSRLSLIKHLLRKYPVERQQVLDLMNSSTELWREHETSLAATLVKQKDLLSAGFTDADTVATAEKALEMTRIFLKQEFDELRKELKDRGVKYDIKSLGSAIEAFNQANAAELRLANSPLLTEDEVCAALWWQLEQTNMPTVLPETIRKVVENRMLPQGWSIQLRRPMWGYTQEWGSAQDITKALDINLVIDESQAIKLRSQFVSSPFLNKADNPNSSLDRAIDGFNERYRNFQPKLTRDETLAALSTVWEDDHGLDEATLDSLKSIARTHELQPQMEINLVRTIETRSGNRYDCWSIRIDVPIVNESGKGFALVIRNRFLKVTRRKDDPDTSPQSQKVIPFPNSWQGNWIIGEATTNANARIEYKGQPVHISQSGMFMRSSIGGNTYLLTLLDSTKTPIEADLSVAMDGARSEWKTFKCLLEVQSDQIILVRPQNDGHPRPTSISRPGKGETLFIMQRTPSDAVSPSEAISLIKRFGARTRPVVVEFQVASVHPPFVQGAPETGHRADELHLDFRPAPPEFSQDQLLVVLSRDCQEQLQKSGISDIKQHFLGKTIRAAGIGSTVMFTARGMRGDHHHIIINHPEQVLILSASNSKTDSESRATLSNDSPSRYPSPKFLNSTTDVEQHVKRLLQDRKNLDHFYVDFKLTGKSVNGGESYSSRYRVWHHDGDWRGDSTMAHPLANRVQLDTSRHCYFLDRLSKKTLFQEGRNRPSLGSIPDFRRVGLIPWSTESLDQFPFENALLHEHHGPLQLRDSEVKGLFKYSYHRNKPEPKLESSTVEVWLDSAHDNYPAKIVTTWIDKDGAGNGRMELNTQWKWDGESWYPAVTDHHYRFEYNGQVSESSERLEVVRWKRFKPNEFPVEVFEPENCLKDHE